MRNPPRTALDRATADLAAAEKRLARANARLDKADTEYQAAHGDQKAAADLVDYYRGAVEKLGGGSGGEAS